MVFSVRSVEKTIRKGDASVKKRVQIIVATSMIVTPTLVSIPLPHSIASVKAAELDRKEDKKDQEMK